MDIEQWTIAYHDALELTNIHRKTQTHRTHTMSEVHTHTPTLHYAARVGYSG